jgi:hypothetical protein
METKTYYTIDDLNFETHCTGRGIRAVATFENGYGASVVSGSIFYSDEKRPYEIAVLHGDDLDYSTPVTDDVCGYLTTAEANEILRQIQDLPKKETEG